MLKSAVFQATSLAISFGRSFLKRMVDGSNPGRDRPGRDCSFNHILNYSTRKDTPCSNALEAKFIHAAEIPVTLTSFCYVSYEGTLTTLANRIGLSWCVTGAIFFSHPCLFIFKIKEKKGLKKPPTTPPPPEKRRQRVLRHILFNVCVCTYRYRYIHIGYQQCKAMFFFLDPNCISCCCLYPDYIAFTLHRFTSF